MDLRLSLAEKAAVFSAFSASFLEEADLGRGCDTDRRRAGTQLQRGLRGEVANELERPPPHARVTEVRPGDQFRGRRATSTRSGSSRTTGASSGPRIPLCADHMAGSGRRFTRRPEKARMDRSPQPADRPSRDRRPVPTPAGSSGVAVGGLIAGPARCATGCDRRRLSRDAVRSRPQRGGRVPRASGV